jgi:hypothetical protein
MIPGKDVEATMYMLYATMYMLYATISEEEHAYL